MTTGAEAGARVGRGAGLPGSNVVGLQCAHRLCKDCTQVKAQKQQQQQLPIPQQQSKVKATLLCIVDYFKGNYLAAYLGDYYLLQSSWL